MTFSEITTKLYGENLCDEALELEKMHKELLKLKAKVISGKPICPICQAVLEPFNYAGYYDRFSGYECKCEKFDKVGVSYGRYA